jgi:hypothetical protein
MPYTKTTTRQTEGATFYVAPNIKTLQENFAIDDGKALDASWRLLIAPQCDAFEYAVSGYMNVKENAGNARGKPLTTAKASNGKKAAHYKLHEVNIASTTTCVEDWMPKAVKGATRVSAKVAPAKVRPPRSAVTKASSAKTVPPKAAPVETEAAKQQATTEQAIPKDFVTKEASFWVGKTGGKESLEASLAAFHHNKDAIDLPIITSLEDLMHHCTRLYQSTTNVN